MPSIDMKTTICALQSEIDKLKKEKEELKRIAEEEAKRASCFEDTLSLTKETLKADKARYTSTINHLRHVLDKEKKEKDTLVKEIEFLKDYIMKLSKSKPDIKSESDPISIENAESYKDIPYTTLLEAFKICNCNPLEEGKCLRCPLEANPNCSAIMPEFTFSLYQDQEEKIERLKESLISTVETMESEYQNSLEIIKSELDKVLSDIVFTDYTERKIRTAIKKAFEIYET